MSDILLSGDPGQLAFIRAMADPDTTKAALGELTEAKSQAEAALAALHEKETEHQAMLAEANQRLADAAKMMQQVEARGAELDDFEARLREVQAGLNAEKAAFEDVRAQVRADHASQQNELDERDLQLAQAEQMLSAAQYDPLEMARSNVVERQRLTALREQLDAAIKGINAGAGVISAAIAKLHG